MAEMVSLGSLLSTGGNTHVLCAFVEIVAVGWYRCIFEMVVLAKFNFGATVATVTTRNCPQDKVNPNLPREIWRKFSPSAAQGVFHYDPK